MTIEVEVGNIVQVVDDRNLIVIDQGNTVEVAAMGAQGPTGPTGATGPQGPSGVISVTAPITNSGSSTSAVIGVNVGTTSATVAAGDRGLPTGGTTGQILAKSSSADYATTWVDRYPLTTSIIGSNSGLLAFGLPNVEYFGQINATHPASTLCVWPFAVNDSIIITDWVTSIMANTSATSRTLRAGLYQLNSSFQVTSLVQEFPTLTVPTGTGNYVVALASPLTVTRGRYAIAWNTDTTQYTFRLPRATTPLQAIFAGAGASIARFRSGAEGATNVANPLPNPATSATLSVATDTQNWGPAVNLLWTLA